MTGIVGNILGPSDDELRSMLASKVRRRRFRLWELNPGIHGALFAVALDESEWPKLIRRSGACINDDVRHYDLHSHLCDHALSRSRLAEILDRHLDQKHARTILALPSSLDRPALAAAWRAGMANGRRIGGLFWACLTHPASDTELRTHFYAEVHALFYGAFAERDRLRDQVGSLEIRLRALRRLLDRAAPAEKAAAERSPMPADEADLPLRLAHAIAAQELSHLRASRAEERIRSLEAKIARLEAAMPRHRAVPVVVSERAARVEAAAAAGATAEQQLEAEQRPLDRESLSGLRMLYVGGRRGAVRRIDELLAGSGALLAHHDGGIEDSPVRLEQMLVGADLVFYPVDTVSHEAVIRIKAHAKESGKPAIPLRAASVSAFRRALRAWCGL